MRFCRSFILDYVHDAHATMMGYFVNSDTRSRRLMLRTHLHDLSKYLRVCVQPQIARIAWIRRIEFHRNETLRATRSHTHTHKIEKHVCSFECNNLLPTAAAAATLRLNASLTIIHVIKHTRKRRLRAPTHTHTNANLETLLNVRSMES